MGSTHSQRCSSLLEKWSAEEIRYLVLVVHVTKATMQSERTTTSRKSMLVPRSTPQKRFPLNSQTDKLLKNNHFISQLQVLFSFRSHHIKSPINLPPTAQRAGLRLRGPDWPQTQLFRCAPTSSSWSSSSHSSLQFPPLVSIVLFY